MSQGLIMTLAALLVGTKAFSINYGFPAGFNPYGPGKKGYEVPPPLQLTCSAIFTSQEDKNAYGTEDKNGYGTEDRKAYVTEAIVANFRDKAALNPALGFSYGAPFNPLYGALPSTFGHSPYGGVGGISADIEVYTSTGGKPLTLLLTERGYTGGGCAAENFGYSLIPGRDKRVVPAGYSSFFAGGSGFGATPGAGTGYGSTGYGLPGPLVSGAKGGYGLEGPVPGVLAELHVNPGTLKAVSIDRVDGFMSLQELAGRGVIGCTQVDIDDDGRAKCVGYVPFCCSLAYDNQKRVLQLGY